MIIYFLKKSKTRKNNSIIDSHPHAHVHTKSKKKLTPITDNEEFQTIEINVKDEPKNASVGSLSKTNLNHDIENDQQIQVFHFFLSFFSFISFFLFFVL